MKYSDNLSIDQACQLTGATPQTIESLFKRNEIFLFDNAVSPAALPIIQAEQRRIDCIQKMKNRSRTA